MNSTIIAGLDIGNGYVKGAFDGNNNEKVNVDISSCVAGIVEPPAIPSIPDTSFMNDIFNRMVCQFKTPLIRDSRYFSFGGGALTSNRSLVEFDIADNISKADQELSSVLVLGVCAGAALQNYFNAYGKLPDNKLSVNVQLALALPIDEYKEHRDAFSNKFVSTDHEVVFWNFEDTVVVKLHFLKPNVMPEGVSAQFAIVNKGEAFVQAMLDDVRSKDPKALAGITAADIINCTNTCGIDIGEGTVNFPVISSGRFNQQASVTLQKGYGTILEQSIPRILKANMAFNTRKALADFMIQPTNAFNAKKKHTAEDIITSEAVDLVNEITRQVSAILSGGAGTEVIYVYGGGATPMKRALYDELIARTSRFSGGDPFPILYLDSSYARNLNRQGLYDVAKADYEVSVKSGLMEAH